MMTGAESTLASHKQQRLNSVNVHKREVIVRNLECAGCCDDQWAGPRDKLAIGLDVIADEDAPLAPLLKCSLTSSVFIRRALRRGIQCIQTPSFYHGIELSKGLTKLSK